MPAALAVVGVAGSIYAANKQSKAATSAANTQAQSAQDANRLQLQMFNQARADNEPFRQNALAANNQLMALLGLAPQQAPQPQPTGVNTQGFTQGVYANNPLDRRIGNPKLAAMDPLREMLPNAPQILPAPTQQAAPQTPSMTPQQSQQSAFDLWRSTPGYQFNLDEGRKQLEASAAARGGLYSGQALKALTQYGQNYADRTYGDYMNRLAGISGIAQTVNAQNQQAGMNYANQAGANLINAGNARASGLLGQANAQSNMVNNLAGIAGWYFGQRG